MVRNRTQLRKLSLTGTPEKTLGLIVQFVKAATENSSTEELSLCEVRNLPVGDLVPLIRMNRNIKRMEIGYGCSFVVGGGIPAAAVADGNTINALQTLIIESLTLFTEEAAREFLRIVLQPEPCGTGIRLH